MSIDPILELIKERNAVEERLAAMTIDRDEWEEVAEQFAADSKAYRKERDAFKKRMQGAERLLEDVLLTYHNGMTTLQDHTADQIKIHLEAARKENGQ